MKSIHLYDPAHRATRCGLTLGGYGWQERPDDEVITDLDEADDATCPECIAAHKSVSA